ncbi:MAG: hypothetical protein PVG27_03225 [Chloroflexota bacterium]|jgi:hypothetical protein
MRKALLALTTLAMMATAAPVSAQDSVTGTATMARHGGAEPCTAISWVGTMEIDGHGDMDGTYGYALSKAEDIPATVIADGWLRWAEYFTLYDSVFEQDADGLLVSCEPGAVLLHGYDSGVGLTDGMFWDTGYIIEAGGPFEGMAGARADQLGEFNVWSDEATMPDGKPAPVGFTVDLTIQP